MSLFVIFFFPTHEQSCQNCWNWILKIRERISISFSFSNHFYFHYLLWKPIVLTLHLTLETFLKKKKNLPRRPGVLQEENSFSSKLTRNSWECKICISWPFIQLYTCLWLMTQLNIFLFLLPSIQMAQSVICIKLVQHFIPPWLNIFTGQLS